MTKLGTGGARIAVLLLVLAGVLLGACGSSSSQNDSGSRTPSASLAFDGATVDTSRLPEQPKELLRVSFVAVGDNLIHSSIYHYYRSGAGFDFSGAYADLKPFVEAADFAYINQETVCGGTELGLADYPCFNSPHEVLDAVAGAGFDWVNTASNHTMDKGEAGILSQLDYLATLPELTQTGTHASAVDAATPTVVEVGGLRIGLASYSYGLNGFTLPEGKEYLVDLIDRERIEQDMRALVEVSDVQMVSMHWGTEYSHEPNAEQIELAQLLADLGVDVVVGSHPHAVQPTTMITGASGNKTLVIYSLGNFLSAQDEVPNMLGEMAQWTLAFDPETREVSFENVEMWPTVTQIHPGWWGHKVYTLRDYTDTLAAEHMLAPDLNRAALVDLANSVFGDEFSVLY